MLLVRVYIPCDGGLVTNEVWITMEPQEFDVSAVGASLSAISTNEGDSLYR